MALEKKELNKKYKSIRKDQSKSRIKKLALYIGIPVAIIIVAVVLFIIFA